MLQWRLLAILLMLVVPTQSHAWSLSSRVMTTGGGIQVRTDPVQTSGSGTVLKNYTTSKNVPVSLQPAAGYQISAVSVNGVNLTLPAPNPVLMGLLAYPGKTSQSLTINFAKQLVSVTATTSTSGGTVNPSGTQSLTFGAAASYIFTPDAGGKLISLSGLPSGTTLVSVSTGLTVSLPYAGAVRVSFTVPATTTTISGAFIGIIASSGSPQTTLTNTTVTLSGSAAIYDGSSPATVAYTWTELSGPQQVSLTGANTATPYFTASAAGSYRFQLQTVDALGASSTSTVTINLTPSAATAAEQQCQGCHSQSGIGATSQVFNKWSSSRHKVNVVMCALCHVGADTGNHPGSITSSTVSPTTFIVSATGANFCFTCHTPGIGTEFASAAHGSVLTCSSCHVDPHAAVSFSPVSFRTFSGQSFQGRVVCFNCHGGVNTTHYYSQASVDNVCPDCHNATSHNPAPTMSPALGAQHFNGYTSYTNPGYAAAYVTQATQCANCHKGGDPTTADDQSILQYRQDWAASPHGDLKAPAYLNTASVNWKASGTAGVKVSKAYAPNDCQRCHTSAGYVQFTNLSSITPLAATSARSSEPVTCNGCHNADFTPRSVTPRTGYYNYSSAPTGKLLVAVPFPDTLTSNICLGCHTGRQAGNTIAAIAAATAHTNYSTSFWQNASFVNTHWLTAGSAVFGTTGYEFPGVNYSNAVNHSQVGAGVDGPCVTCHMPGTSHTWNPSAASYTQCEPCHGTTMNSTFVAAKTADFYAALQALGAALAQQGFAPNLVSGVFAPPYFTTTNWGNKDSGPAQMGAAFNYTMLMQDPGAFAHNPTYAKRLVRDSIDYLTNGSIDRSRDLTSTINNLVTNSTVQADASAFLLDSGNGSSACAVCHSDTVDPLTGLNIVATYNTTPHSKVPGGATCSNCHAPTATVAHPPALTMLSATADINLKCTGCHPIHAWPSYGICTNCHNGHDPTPHLPAPHLANYSTAQYITTNLSCTGCHYAVDDPSQPTVLSFNIYSANLQWSRSGKSNPKAPAYVSFDFKTLGNPASPAQSAGNDCVRCHTTTGYVNYVNSNFTDVHAWGTSGLAPGGDRTREMVACPACHSPTPFNSFDSTQVDGFGQPLVPAFSRRGVPAVTAYYNYSAAGAGRNLKSIVYPDLGVSNNCIVCHSGTVAGSTLKLISPRVGGTSGGFWNSAQFIDPHGMAGAGIMFVQTGYHFPTTPRTRTYATPTVQHSGIDDPYYGGQGACIACHLYTDQPHLFSPISSAGNGVVSKVTAYDQVCSECHDGGTQPFDLSNPANLDAKKQGFISSLKALSAVLASKGVYFNPALAPYFFNVSSVAQQGPPSSYYTTWNALNSQNGTNGIYSGEALMGAAFNLRLLWGDGGAYAHNDVYAKKLIYDSIDLVDNGLLDSSVTSAIGALSTSGSSFTADDKTRAQAYVGLRPPN